MMREFRSQHSRNCGQVNGTSDGVARCYANIGEELIEFTADQELILFGIHRVRFDLDRTLPGERDNPSQPVRLKRSDRKEKIRKPMTSSEYAINSLSIKTIAPAFLASAEGEASPDDYVGWQQPSGENVGAEVHVMVAVHPGRERTIQSFILFDLGGHHML